ncbi:unnamed protein product, partial [Musa acuminata var. zebrina]
LISKYSSLGNAQVPGKLWPRNSGPMAMTALAPMILRDFSRGSMPRGGSSVHDGNTKRYKYCRLGSDSPREDDIIQFGNCR